MRFNKLPFRKIFYNPRTNPLTELVAEIFSSLRKGLERGGQGEGTANGAVRVARPLLASANSAFDVLFIPSFVNI